MKYVGTSNSVFLIPPGATDTPASVIKVAQGSIELVQIAPKIDKLKSLLNQRPYFLEEDLDSDPSCKYRWQDLTCQIQASDEELRTGLSSLSAVEIDGYWRILDDKSMDRILDMILNNSILHQWPLHALDEEHVLSIMESDGFPRKLILHCLETFGSKSRSWVLDEKRVCTRLATRILIGGKMKLEGFMEKWTRAVPSTMAFDLSMLEGQVLYEKLGIENWIRSFKVSDLPSSPAERFSALFRERARWQWKDLEPYIRDLRVPGATAEGLLIKYTRRTQPSADVEPVFSAR